jgi:hypothetical protein
MESLLKYNYYIDIIKAVLKWANGLKSLWQFRAVAYLVEGHFLPAMENGVNFLILGHRILKLTLSTKEGQNLDPIKVWMWNGCQVHASSIIKYANLEHKVHKYSCKEYTDKSKGSIEQQTSVGCVPANWH